MVKIFEKRNNLAEIRELTYCEILLRIIDDLFANIETTEHGSTALYW